MATFQVTVPSAKFARNFIASAPSEAVALAFPNHAVRSDRAPNVFVNNLANALTGFYVEGIPPQTIINAKEWGAAGDGSTDDSAALNAAAAYVASVSGMLYMPQGNYLCNANPFTVTGPGPVAIVADAPGSAQIFSTVPNNTVMSVTGTRHVLRNLLINNNTLGTTAGAVLQLNNCIQVKVDNCWVQGGFYPMWVIGTNCTDNVFADSIFLNGAGTANVYVGGNTSGINGAHYFNRCLFNQQYPAGTPAAANFKGARANTTAYNLKDVVSIVQGSQTYYIQCTVAGTSGSSQPTIVWFGQNMTDGGVTWQLMANVSLRGIQFDTGSIVCNCYGCDATGPFLNAYDVTNTLSSTLPQQITFNNCNTDGAISNGFNLGVGNDHAIILCKAGQGVGPAPTNGVQVSAEGCKIIGSQGIFTFTNGILLNASSKNTAVIGNLVTGCTTGIAVAAGTLNFTIQGNICGSTTAHGLNTNSIQVLAGASDHYMIRGNIVAGATNVVQDGGTGVNKDVGGNF